MNANKYQKLAMRTNDGKARYPEGFDVERANNRAEGEIPSKRAEFLTKRMNLPARRGDGMR